jgi:hypothetical protein
VSETQKKGQFTLFQQRFLTDDLGGPGAERAVIHCRGLRRGYSQTAKRTGTTGTGTTGTGTTGTGTTGTRTTGTSTMGTAAVDPEPLTRSR